MDTVLKNVLWKFAMVYLDDINIYSKTWEEHLAHVEEVLKRLRKAGLMINPDKCYFTTKELEFLGYIVDRNGVKPDPAKIKKVQEYSWLKSISEVHRFMGLASYYRKFIKNFSGIAKSLFELTQKDIGFNWNEECEKSFTTLKEKLTTALILKYPDYKKKFILLTNTLKIALEAILS